MTDGFGSVVAAWETHGRALFWSFVITYAVFVVAGEAAHLVGRSPMVGASTVGFAATGVLVHQTLRGYFDTSPPDSWESTDGDRR